jgi:hypothetical protein
MIDLIYNYIICLEQIKVSLICIIYQQYEYLIVLNFILYLLYVSLLKKLAQN